MHKPQSPSLLCVSYLLVVRHLSHPVCAHLGRLVTAAIREADLRMQMDILVISGVTKCRRHLIIDHPWESFLL